MLFKKVKKARVSIWQILEIDETKDFTKINKAHSEMLLKYQHEPKKLNKINQARDMALTYANGLDSLQKDFFFGDGKLDF